MTSSAVTYGYVWVNWSEFLQLNQGVSQESTSAGWYWLIVSKITPRFVIIPGSEKADYKDFSHHYKAHAKATIGLILICFIIAGIVWYF
jgi:hypothetical protein